MCHSILSSVATTGWLAFMLSRITAFTWAGYANTRVGLAAVFMPTYKAGELMELYELVYVSAARREMSLSDLTALLEQSRKKNARLHITGLLVYHQREFMQLLEGSKSDIFSVYETICKDERNQQNRLLWDGPIAQRSFANWSMAFLVPSELSLEGKPAYSTFLQQGFGAQALSTPKTMGKRFLLSLRDDFLRE